MQNFFVALMFHPTYLHYFFLWVRISKLSNRCLSLSFKVQCFCTIYFFLSIFFRLTVIIVFHSITSVSLYHFIFISLCILTSWLLSPVRSFILPPFFVNTNLLLFLVLYTLVFFSPTFLFVSVLSVSLSRQPVLLCVKISVPTRTQERIQPLYGKWTTLTT